MVIAMVEAEDCLLLQRFCAGDATAFEMLYMRHWPSLVALAGRRIGDPSGAQDIAQESFDRLAKLAPTTAIAQPGAYLRRIATNLCCDQLKMKQLAVQPLEESFIDTALDPMAAHIHRQSRKEVHSVLKHLTPAQRQVLYLRTVERCSYAQIGETLGLSERAVEGLLARAFRRFREEYAARLDVEEGELAGRHIGASSDRCGRDARPDASSVESMAEAAQRPAIHRDDDGGVLV